VHPLAWPDGGPPPSNRRDKPILVAWLEAFAREALDEFYPDPGAAVDRWLSTIGFRQGWIWEDEGPVSFAGISGLTPHGIRLGPVYTPPEHRRRGYAGNLVAAASQAQLDRGRSFVFLFTDLANRTSNHVYQQIGYEPVIDISQWTFDRRDDPIARGG
jgi:predicted GNAT family acetyltransferase